MPTISLLKNISVVLVDTKSPANIGSVARAMMNMGLSRLVLVRPPRDKQGDASKLAAGAQEVLAAAVIYSCLSDAVADQGLVIGSSRHAGRMRKNVRTPRDMAAQVIPLLDRNKISLVFGNEVNGLEMEDLALCHEIITIPSSEAFPSLNLSHAVMITAYELAVAAGGPADPAKIVLAGERELERFYAHLQQTLQDLEFLDQHKPERMMFSLRQIFGRARLESRDVSILRGVLSAINRATGGGEKI